MVKYFRERNYNIINQDLYGEIKRDGGVVKELLLEDMRLMREHKRQGPPLRCSSRFSSTLEPSLTYF
jgi:hypothetical protein